MKRIVKYWLTQFGTLNETYNNNDPLPEWGWKEITKEEYIARMSGLLKAWAETHYRHGK